uniref:Obscurin like cytoskeletal adaptor 1 n=1 Tax=Athene cunicularia TaxID=194338 RepID=A0A663MXI4_ATHCN
MAFNTQGLDPAYGLTLWSGEPAPGRAPLCHRAQLCRVTARGAPRFLAYPRAFTVQSGTDAVLSCQITGDPQPSRFHMEVLYCKPQDQGLYVCTASNTAGQTLSAVQLHVKGRRVPKHYWGRPGTGGVQGFSSVRDASVSHPAPQHPSPALMHLFS